MVRQFVFLCLFALVSSSAAAVAQDVPVTDCDRLAAEADDPERQAAGVSDDGLDAALAVPACERAVEQFPASRRLVFQLGRAYLKTANLKGAFVRFHQAAEQGHVLAQTYLGTLYLEGTGVARNDAQAVIWFSKSAEQGDAVAQYNLGVMQETGRGIARDEAQAAAWYRKAAEQGFSLAQSSLGRIYAAGRGVAKDDAQAAAWYRKAAEQGDANGQYRLAAMYAEGRGVAKDPGEAIAWYRKAADQGYLDAAKQVETLETASAQAAPTPAPTGAPAPAAQPDSSGGDRPAGKAQWLLRIVIGVIGLVIIAALVAFLLLRGKSRQRSVTRQIESLKLEALRSEPRTAPESDEKPAPASALSTFASQIEAIPALPPEPEAESAAKREADRQQDEEPAADDQAPAKVVSEEAAKEPTEAKEPMQTTETADTTDATTARPAEPAPQFVAEAVEEPAASPPMKRCSQCQNEIPPNDYFCCHCGALAIRFSDCQHDVRDNARFCPRCGAILRWSTPKAAAIAGALPSSET